jgi:predicted glycoside hydrolase/deacetylase ChbG (UPF0249 family)
VSERRVVVHQDDVGMSHGANVAFLELSRLGAVTCGSVMVPCPWFREIAEAAAADPSLDVGVHLTLTSEKQHYRWGPITGASAAGGLTDPDGYLWRDVSSVRRHADPAAAEAELRAQVERALGAGIDVTHLDAHMGAVLAPELCDIYLRLGRDLRLPILLTTTLAGYAPNNHLAGVTEADHAPFVEQARRDGQPLFDVVLETPWDRGSDEPVEPRYRALFQRAGPGLSFLALHPNAPGELEAIEPESAHIRTGEYDLLRSDEHRAWLSAQDLELVGMRELRENHRAGLTESF